MEDQAEQLRQRMKRLAKHFVIRARGRVIEIVDRRTGRVTEVPSLAYCRERQALDECFREARWDRPFASGDASDRSHSPNCCSTSWC